MSNFVRKSKKRLRTLLSGPLRCLVVLFNPPVERVHDKQAVFLYAPAFQAGCREFESRLPLFLLIRRSQPASQAPLEQATYESISGRRFCFMPKGVQRTPAFVFWETPASLFTFWQKCSRPCIGRLLATGSASQATIEHLFVKYKGGRCSLGGSFQNSFRVTYL